MLPDFFPCSFHRCCYCCCRYCVVLISHVSKILTCERQRHENALRGLFVSFCEYCSAVLTLGNSFFWHSNIRTQRKRVFDIFHWLLLFVSPLFRFSYLFFSQWLWLCATTTTVVLIFFGMIFFSCRIVIRLNGCFNAVISCFITDKILHLTLTNNMPLWCRWLSSVHNQPQNWTARNKS